MLYQEIFFQLNLWVVSETALLAKHVHTSKEFVLVLVLLLVQCTYTSQDMQNDR